MIFIIFKEMPFNFLNKDNISGHVNVEEINMCDYLSFQSSFSSELLQELFQLFW